MAYASVVTTALPQAATAPARAAPARAPSAAPCGNQALLRRLQTKLKVGAVNDPLEHEADRVADQVMRMTDTAAMASAPPQVNRKCAACEHEVSRKCADCEKEEKLQRKEAGPQAAAGEAPASVHETLRSHGQPLGAATRAYFEPRFGRDFSGVRVHTGASAAQSAREVNAHAYTVGHDIAFDSGRFAPGSHDGRRLIAHELAHVVQQGEAVTSRPQDRSTAPSEARRHRDAHHAAKAAVTESTSVTAMPSSVTQGLASPRSASILQRQPCDPANDHIVTGPLATQLPAVTSDPAPATLQDVRAVPGVPQTIMGVTQSAFTTDQITFQEGRGGRCNAQVTPASMTINRSIFTKEGTFPDGTERTPPGRRCPAGQVIQKRMHVTADGARKLKKGEAEHCDDAKLAFALSWGKFNQASKDLAGDYCASGIHATGAETICDKEFAKRFSNRTGVEWSKRKDAADCLLGKSALRDNPPNNWHDVAATGASYATDCSAITYEITAASTPEIGRHSSADLVKGCGEQ